jgi:hypothetical protein
VEIMPILNANIPAFKALCRKSHFTKDKSDADTYLNVYVFGIQSIQGKILTFHVMTDDGMLRSRVPISEIFIKPAINDVPFYFKQLWDCFSENVSVIQYDWLREHRADIILRDRKIISAQYILTIDWYDNPYSDEPSDYKCGHLMKADDGYLLLMPNNRMLWHDSNWITKKPEDLNIFKVDSELPSVENICDKWMADDSDKFYYDINKV